MVVDIYEVFQYMIILGGKHINMRKKMKIKIIYQKTLVKLIPTLQNQLYFRKSTRDLKKLRMTKISSWRYYLRISGENVALVYIYIYIIIYIYAI